jgi:uncharacterized protein (TIGR03086 family)
MPAADHLAMHRQALAAASSVVERVAAVDLTRPTPCGAWDLRQLLEHMVGQHLGFTAVIRDGAAPVEAYHPVPFTQPAWRTSVDELLAAFATADLDARVVEVELHPTHPLPVGVLLGAQLLDTVVHTWDVAAALGEPYAPPPDVVDAVLAIAATIPDDDGRERPGAAFAHAVATGEGTWERALGLLGRDPRWPAVRPPDLIPGALAGP